MTAIIEINEVVIIKTEIIETETIGDMTIHVITIEGIEEVSSMKLLDL